MKMLQVSDQWEPPRFVVAARVARVEDDGRGGSIIHLDTGDRVHSSRFAALVVSELESEAGGSGDG